MFRLAVLLSCLIALEAARYGDYSGAQMPHFGISYDNKESASDEYSDRSQDAAASLDYKYEEEPRNKIDTSDQDVEDARQIKRKFKSTDERDSDYANEQDAPGFKSKRRYQKHRPRMKDSYKDSKKKSIEYDEINNEDDDLDNNQYINKHRSRDDNRLDVDNFDFRYITRRSARRKPRDRTISRERSVHFNIDDDIDLKLKESNVDAAELDYQSGDRRPKTLDRTRLPYIDLESIKHKNYPEYEDTIRFNTIRNKLPELFRQTKASASPEEIPSTRLLQDIPYRRANLEESEASVTESSPDTTSTEKVVITVSLTTQSKEKSTNTTELSLAEKSRLSILKKAQKKEGSRNMTKTTKPPVLMQVTKRMQTVVMIETPNRDINLRAREIFDESPERLNRAKKLMRRKLVSGDRSINDFIDNWDEMVCDYIDTSLLNNSYHVLFSFQLILLSAINNILIFA